MPQNIGRDKSPGNATAVDENYALMVANCLLNDYGILTSYFDLEPEILRFEPPLVVTKPEIDHAIDSFDQVVSLGVGGLVLSV